MATVYDRIDLKVTGTWYKNFRPNGLTLSFGTNLAGGDVYTSLSNVTLPYGIIIGSMVRKKQIVTNYKVNNLNMPKTIDGLQLTGVTPTSTGVLFSDTTIFDSKIFPEGVTDPGGKALPNNTLVSCHIDSTSVSNIVLSATNLGLGTAVSGGVVFSPSVTLNDVYIPFGVKFITATTIKGKTYPIGIFKIATSDKFLMQTVQLIDSKGAAIISVHDTESDELLAFNRPTTDISRLVMYRKGVGVDADPFGCYSIVFRTNITLADIQAFNKNHPSDIDPLIVDDGSVANPKYIIPAN